MEYDPGVTAALLPCVNSPGGGIQIFPSKITSLPEFILLTMMFTFTDKRYMHTLLYSSRVRDILSAEMASPHTQERRTAHTELMLNVLRCQLTY